MKNISLFLITSLITLNLFSADGEKQGKKRIFESGSGFGRVVIEDIDEEENEQPTAASTNTTSVQDEESNSDEDQPSDADVIRFMKAFVTGVSVLSSHSQTLKTVSNIEKTLQTAILKLATECNKLEEYKNKIAALNNKTKEQQHNGYFNFLQELSDIVSKQKNEPAGEIIFTRILAAISHIKQTEKAIAMFQDDEIEEVVFAMMSSFGSSSASAGSATPGDVVIDINDQAQATSGAGAGAGAGSNNTRNGAGESGQQNPEDEGCIIQ